MQIVIDIPEEDYESMKWTSVKNGVTNSYYYLRELILNGTPLPKGHGDLIDRNSILCDDCICPCGHADECFRLLAPTIIDKDGD